MTPNEMRRELVRLFPNCFMPRRKPKRPLKYGLIDDILWRYPQFDSNVLRRSLADYVAGSTYLECLIANAVRVDLDGASAGFVTQRQAEHAVHALAKLQQNNARQKQAKAARRNPAANAKSTIEARH